MKKHINNCLDKILCTGCTACQSTCPEQCISMKPDEEGFLYPAVDEENCIDCRICSQTCPVLNPPEVAKSEEPYAMISKDESARLSSSSGGIMSLLAQEILNNNGTVYGAAYDEEYRVIHKRIDQIEDLDQLRRAKYAQSDLHGIFRQVREDLKNGPVLFVGSPCQCAGLHAYIFRRPDSVKQNNGVQKTVPAKSQTESDKSPANCSGEKTQLNGVVQGNLKIQKTEDDKLKNRLFGNQLILVDFVCHSIPSPAVWESYVKWKSGKGKPESINQRSKKTGWSSYSYSIEFNYQNETTDLISNGKDIYMKLFIGDYITRHSCAGCHFKGSQRSSDLTLGDFWGIWDLDPSMDDNKGTSLVVAHTEIGEEILRRISSKVRSKKVGMNDATSQNPAYIRSCEIPEERNKILRRALDGDFELLEKEMIKPEGKPGILKRILARLNRI